MSLDLVQVLSWINMVIALSTYFLASRHPQGFWSLDRPAYHLAQLVCAFGGVYIFMESRIWAWVVFNIVWIGIGSDTLRRLYAQFR